MAAWNEDINKTGGETKVDSENVNKIFIFIYLGSLRLK